MIMESKFAEAVFHRNESAVPFQFPFSNTPYHSPAFIVHRRRPSLSLCCTPTEPSPSPIYVWCFQKLDLSICVGLHQRENNCYFPLFVSKSLCLISMLDPCRAIKLFEVSIRIFLWHIFLQQFLAFWTLV